MLRRRMRPASRLVRGAHDLSWSQGGGTSVKNDRLLCSFHHHKAHNDDYETQRLPSGKVRFHRRN
jgi:hypothetical protein